MQTLSATRKAWTTDVQIPGKSPLSPKDLCFKFRGPTMASPGKRFPAWRSRFAIREAGKSPECAARIVGAFGCVENEQHCGWFSAVRSGFRFPHSLPRSGAEDGQFQNLSKRTDPPATLPVSSHQGSRGTQRRNQGVHHRRRGSRPQAGLRSQDRSHRQGSGVQTPAETQGVLRTGRLSGFHTRGDS